MTANLLIQLSIQQHFFDYYKWVWNNYLKKTNSKPRYKLNYNMALNETNLLKNTNIHTQK